MRQETTELKKCNLSEVALTKDCSSFERENMLVKPKNTKKCNGEVALTR